MSQLRKPVAAGLAGRVVDSGGPIAVATGGTPFLSGNLVRLANERWIILAWIDDIGGGDPAAPHILGWNGSIAPSLGNDLQVFLERQTAAGGGGMRVRCNNGAGADIEVSYLVLALTP